MMKAAKLFLLTASLLAAAQTTTTYQINSGFCNNNTNCVVYNPDETLSLWWDSAPNAYWVVFDINAWTPGFMTLNTYGCGGGNGGTITFTSATDGNCSSLDAYGIPFQMSWTVTLTPYRSCGRAGCRTYYHVNGVTVTVTQ